MIKNRYFEMTVLLSLLGIAMWFQYSKGNKYFLGYSIAMATLIIIVVSPLRHRQILAKPSSMNYFLYYSGLVWFLCSIIFINDGHRILHTNNYKVNVIGSGKLFQIVTRDIFNALGPTAAVSFLFSVSTLCILIGWMGMQYSKGSLVREIEKQSNKSL